MRSILLTFAASAAVWAAVTPALADDAHDALLKSAQAQLAAPMCRMTVKSKDADSGKSTGVVIETVNPGQMHVRQEQDGKVMMEMFTDGKKTMIRRGGADAPIVEAPPSVGGMISNMRNAGSMKAIAEAAKDVKEAGHEVIDGQASTIYSFTTDIMGIHGNSKIWISDKDALPLKAEGDSTGSMEVPGVSSAHKVNRHTVITFVYDPALSIALPAAG